MSLLEEVLLECLIGPSPIWAALTIGAICWAARHVGETTGRTPPPLRRYPSPASMGGLDGGRRAANDRPYGKNERRTHEARRI